MVGSGRNNPKLLDFFYYLSYYKFVKGILFEKKNLYVLLLFVISNWAANIMLHFTVLITKSCCWLTLLTGPGHWNDIAELYNLQKKNVQVKIFQ